MKNTFRIIALMLLSVTLFNCSKEELETHSHQSISNKDEISFRQFKAETGIAKFDYIKTANINRSTDLMARDIEAEFVTDTIGIKKYVNPVDSKTTYSFKIYPVSEDLNSKEYYNLVYEKIGIEWNEIIFFNTEKSNPTYEGELESSEMVFNRMSARAGYAVVVTYTVVCTNNEFCIQRGSCDGLTCKTGECVQKTISYVWVGFEDTGNGPDGSLPSSGNPSNAGGGDSSGIYIPNPYDGDVAIDNLDFLLAGQVVAFTSTLAPELQDLIIEHNFIHSFLIDFCRKNGNGVRLANQLQITAALNNFLNFQTNLNPTNLSNANKEKFKLWGFYSFLNNNFLGVNTVKIDNIKSFIQNAGYDAGNTIVDYLYENKGAEDVINFTEQLIVQATLNPTLNLDINVSANSPSFIDMSSVMGNTPQEIKFRKTYDMLTKSPTFRKLFVDLFGPTPLFSVKFVIEDIPQSGPNYINGKCTLSTSGQNTSFYNVITIDKDHLLEDSDVNIALTTLHECVHAYLNIKLRHPTIGMTINNINDMDFQECVNTYYNGFSGNQTQHSFFVDNMIPVMVSVLNEIKNEIFTLSQIFSVENPESNAIIYGATNTIPATINYNVALPWNWDTYFTHLCTVGLESSISFPIIYPSGSSNLLNRNQYLTIGIFTFNP